MDYCRYRSPQVRKLQKKIGACTDARPKHASWCYRMCRRCLLTPLLWEKPDSKVVRPGGVSSCVIDAPSPPPHCIRHPPCAVDLPRVGSIAIVQDRARDLSYPSWRLTPIYDPDPLDEGVEGMDDSGRLLEDLGESLLVSVGLSSDGRLCFVGAS